MSDTSETIYMDYASTTPVSEAVVASMLPYFTEDFYNPSALYIAARKVHKDLERARASIAEVLQVRPVEVMFMAGSTEANNTVLQGVMNQYPDCSLVFAATEHDSVKETAQRYKNAVIPVTPEGVIRLDTLQTIITDNTVLVSCMLANNETGVVQPVSELVRAVVKIRAERIQRGIQTPLYVHTDAAQAFNYEKVLPHQLGVDFAVVSGSKIYGPKQSAVLFVRQGLPLMPLMYGGGQENGLRSGTENIPYCIGLAVAITEAANMRESETARMTELQRFAINELQNRFKVEINGHLQRRLPNNVNVYIQHIDNERLVMQLDERGIMAAVGSACHASSDEPSHVLRAMGYGEERAKSSVRFTFGRQTTKQHVETLLSVLEELLQG